MGESDGERKSEVPAVGSLAYCNGFGGDQWPHQVVETNKRSSKQKDKRADKLAVIDRYQNTGP